MIPLLALWIGIRHGPKMLFETLQLYAKHAIFWTIAGSIGFGLFYGSLCLASNYAPGWVIASTWQFTIIAGILIFPIFGKKIPLRGLTLSTIIFAGILLVNLGSRKAGEVTNLFWGIVPILLSAFAYPIGNQMVGEAKDKGFKRIPKIEGAPMALAPCRAMMMGLGSLPFWILLILIMQPSAPSTSQLIQTAIVALSSGLIATSLFLHARHSSTVPLEIASVDATQAAEIIFTLTMEAIFLGANLPGLEGIIGLLTILAGLVAYSRSQAKA